ncbi:hypothetical protein JOM56_009478 [Amanita muscaria]
MAYALLKGARAAELIFIFWGATWLSLPVALPLAIIPVIPACYFFISLHFWSKSCLATRFFPNDLPLVRGRESATSLVLLPQYPSLSPSRPYPMCGYNSSMNRSCVHACRHTWSITFSLHLLSMTNVYGNSMDILVRFAHVCELDRSIASERFQGLAHTHSSMKMY